MISEYVVVLLKLFAYVIMRLQFGVRLTDREKHQLLEGLLRLGQNFIADYNNDRVGSTRVDLPPLGDLRVPALTLRENEETVP